MNIFHNFIPNKDLFNHFYCNNLFMKNQSGSMPGNSCIFQLSIVHKNNSSLDCNPTIDVRGVLLNIYNAFDKGWHEGFLFKRESWWYWRWTIQPFQGLPSRAPAESSSWRSGFFWEAIKSGVPQVPLLGPILFLVYINNLSNGLSSTRKIFADDTSLFSFVHDKYNSHDELNSDLTKTSDWVLQLENGI